MPRPATQFLDDMGHVLAALFGNAVSARGQARSQAQQKLGLLLQRLQLVSRDEFDALHDMLKTARAEQEKLRARLEALETRARAKTATVKPRVKGKLKTAKKTAAAPPRRRIKHRRRSR